MQGSRWTGAATSFPAASSSTSYLPASSRLKARPRPSGTRYATNPTAILRKSILKALAKKPEDRYASARDFAEALAKSFETRGGVSIPSEATILPTIIHQDRPD